MASLTTYFTETFTGTNGAAWGANWTNAVSDTGASATIQGNRGRQSAGTSTSGQRVDRYSGTNQTDVEFSGTFVVNTSSTAAGIEIWIRGDDATNNGNGYFLAMNLGSKPVLSKGAGFTYPSIATLSSAPTLAQGSQYGWRLYAVGSTIKAKVWLVSGGEPGSYDFSGTDTTHSTAGQCWLRIGNGGGTASQTIDWDDVTLTDGVSASVSWSPPLPVAATHADRRLYPQQRDRRDANTLGTPVTPLVPELTGYGYARAAAMASYVDRRLYPQQKDPRNALLVATPANPADPLLFSAESTTAWATLPQRLDRSWTRPRPAQYLPLDVVPDVLGSSAVQAWRRDPVQPQQRPCESDPSMLATAQLEGALLGGMDDLQRHRTWYSDRRLYPAQLVTYDVDLATAELEGVLLGGATTAGRALVPASHAPRWWMPQQPVRDGQSPGLLDDALLEGVLLGGADVARHATWFTDRRLVPQQPARLADASGLAPDLTLSGLLPSLVARWVPATHADRRLVPAQLVKWADVGVVPVTDPILSGAVPRWVAQTPAFAADRREVPQQRAYVSDPLLLATALLDELLGQGDVARHLQWFARPTWPQQQHVLVDQSGQPFDSTTAAPGPRLVQLTAALLVDRREVPQQPPRWSVPDQLGALLEGVLLGGADDIARHRSWWPRSTTFPAARGAGAPAVPADPLAGAWASLWQRWALAAWLRVPARGQQRIALLIVGSVRPGRGGLGHTRGAAGTASTRTGTSGIAGHQLGPSGASSTRTGPASGPGHTKGPGAEADTGGY